MNGFSRPLMTETERKRPEMAFNRKRPGEGRDLEKKRWKFRWKNYRHLFFSKPPWQEVKKGHVHLKKSNLKCNLDFFWPFLLPFPLCCPHSVSPSIYAPFSLFVMFLFFFAIAEDERGGNEPLSLHLTLFYNVITIYSLKISLRKTNGEVFLAVGIGKPGACVFAVIREDLEGRGCGLKPPLYPFYLTPPVSLSLSPLRNLQNAWGYQ